MSSRQIRWLYEELPALVDRGVLTEDGAERLRDHFGPVENRGSMNLALLAFGVLGSLLVGGGIILLFAEYWDQLARWQRTAVAVVPLLVSLLLAGWALRRRPGSAAWREGSATLAALMLGSAIAILVDTYRLPISERNSLLLWVVLVGLLSLIMRSNVVAVIFLIGATVWATISEQGGGHALWFWPLATVVMVPHLQRAVGDDRYGVRASNLLWAIALCVCVATGFSLSRTMPGLWIVVYAGLFALMLVAAIRWFPDAAAAWQQPLQWVGVAGTLVLSMMLTFPWPWDQIGWQHYRGGGAFVERGGFPDVIFAVGIPALAIVLLVASVVRRNRLLPYLWCSSPVVAALAYPLVASTNNEIIGTVLFNLYLFVLGLGTLAVGLRDRKMGIINAGMVILAALIVVRFFDSEIAEIVKGLAFIAVGAGFLTANLILARKMAPSSDLED
jgi:uncharacterized membrane protein